MAKTDKQKADFQYLSAVGVKHNIVPRFFLLNNRLGYNFSQEQINKILTAIAIEQEGKRLNTMTNMFRENLAKVLSNIYTIEAMCCRRFVQFAIQNNEIIIECDDTDNAPEQLRTILNRNKKPSLKNGSKALVAGVTIDIANMITFPGTETTISMALFCREEIIKYLHTQKILNEFEKIRYIELQESGE